MQQHHFKKIAVFRRAIKRVGEAKVRDGIGYNAFDSADHAENELLSEAPDSNVAFAIACAQRDYETFTGGPFEGETVWDKLEKIATRGAYWEFE